MIFFFQPSGEVGLFNLVVRREGGRTSVFLSNIFQGFHILFEFQGSCVNCLKGFRVLIWEGKVRDMLRLCIH